MFKQIIITRTSLYLVILLQDEAIFPIFTAGRAAFHKAKCVCLNCQQMFEAELWASARMVCSLQTTSRPRSFKTNFAVRTPYSLGSVLETCYISNPKCFRP